jgi:flagella synthesis protein FlgN
MNAPLHAELKRALSDVLDEMRAAVDELASVLTTEQAALRSADTEALNHAGNRKQTLMMQLEQLDAERLQLASATPHVSAALEPTWRDVLDALRTCRELNQRNGSLVGERLGSVRRALAVLTGRTPDDGIYGRAGALQTTPHSQLLVEA